MTRIAFDWGVAAVYMAEAAADPRQRSPGGKEAAMFNMDSAQLVALGGAVGAVLTKVMDGLLARKKTDLDAVNARLAAINEANSQLTTGLLQHIDRLEKEVREVREALAHCDENHVKATKELNALRAEVASLRAAVKPLD